MCKAAGFGVLVVAHLFCLIWAASQLRRLRWIRGSSRDGACLIALQRCTTQKLNLYLHNLCTRAITHRPHTTAELGSRFFDSGLSPTDPPALCQHSASWGSYPSSEL
ncbi:hypothetical protein QBC35DRAFT_225164 [Podospora australis]|uniref:Uncharacterized protein n=1 Tax=Podospora australis TaxID=1536484 RepID=A0AAN7AMT7_9PEZI|nr:hypothetical protein QBC35DRAFT_225164 [Podospora australis]